jgi:hypothetical protein
VEQFLWQGQRPVAASCEHGNETSGSGAKKLVGWIVS